MNRCSDAETCWSSMCDIVWNVCRRSRRHLGPQHRLRVSIHPRPAATPTKRIPSSWCRWESRHVSCNIDSGSRGDELRFVTMRMLVKLLGVVVPASGMQSPHDASSTSHCHLTSLPRGPITLFGHFRVIGRSRMTQQRWNHWQC